MSGIGRASVTIAAGTILSRLAGFVRAMVLVSAIGSFGAASNAFAIANQLPNNIFALISTGLLTAVIVPQIVKSSQHEDGGDAFVSRLMTLGTVVLLITTVLAVVTAPLLVTLYAPKFSPEQAALATQFAYWCLPQIFFYGLYALLGETLNARRVYGPYTWAPIANNVVSIIGFGAFFLLFGTQSDVTGWDTSRIAFLGATATGGIVLQAVVLLLFWRRSGIRLRPDFHWRGVGLDQTVKLAGWTFLMVVIGQIAGVIQSQAMPPSGHPGALASGNAWLLYMLPYSIIVLSIGTPYFTQLSEHAAHGRDDDVRKDIVSSIRTLGFFIVIAAAALAVAAVPASRIFTNTAEEASAAALVLLCFLVGLIPVTVLFVIQRTFYAYHDTRTPFFFTVVQVIIVIATAVAANLLLPDTVLAAGIALGQSASFIVQTIVATYLLHRRLGDLRIRVWLGSLTRFMIAAVPAAGAGWLVFLAFGAETGWMVESKVLGALGAALIGVAALVVYVGALALLRAPELKPALQLIARLASARR